ncbi:MULTISPECIES: phosphonate metabolism transcriptional regulator PhnF [Pacificibacter]|uniref:phosphonate metabolism transcriptional regulator PhnF n=1 Tax=Pacificibacter TaxID=1042323 RepID=UPI001C09923C|nr:MULTISPECIES: phosphonate metabolism transcriptional regulator PhnF [Pacificibacter]MBU2937738.1 phosphonate metabolism transcriptional regulator PhnF [Pacificibacter marinus]MDO6616232.1 phosphonate metabolism transcriptional regulator PhnF [Pacificibacter sp. 1_MG-2023]
MNRNKWSIVCDGIEMAITSGQYPPGEKLPTEPELAIQFGVGRHSVRRAIAELAKAGKVSVEQGRGTFVESGPLLEYAIGQRTRLRKNLLSQGVDIHGELLDAQIITASAEVARALNLGEGAQVLQSQRITFGDGVPLAFGRAFHCPNRFPDFVARRDVLGSATEAYKTYGIDDYLRAQTTMHARLAQAHEAKTLKLHPQTAVMVVRAIDQLLDGTPISFSEVIWAASRVKFTMTNED